MPWAVAMWTAAGIPMLWQMKTGQVVQATSPEYSHPSGAKLVVKLRRTTIMSSKNLFKTIISSWSALILKQAPCATFLTSKQDFWVLSRIVKSKSPRETSMHLQNLDLTSSLSSLAMVTTCQLRVASFQPAKQGRSISKFRRLFSSMLWVTIKLKRYPLKAKAQASSKDRTCTRRKSKKASRNFNLRKSWNFIRSILSLLRKKLLFFHLRPNACKKLT